MSVKINFEKKWSVFDEPDHRDAEGTQFRKDLPPGSAVWVGDQGSTHRVLYFTCPCGCGAVVGITTEAANHPGWKWDGNELQPTLTPSILRTAGCRWHGYLTAGEFKAC